MVTPPGPTTTEAKYAGSNPTATVVMYAEFAQSYMHQPKIVLGSFFRGRIPLIFSLYRIQNYQLAKHITSIYLLIYEKMFRYSNNLVLRTPFRRLCTGAIKGLYILVLYFHA